MDSESGLLHAQEWEHARKHEQRTADVLCNCAHTLTVMQFYSERRSIVRTRAPICGATKER